MAAGLEGWVAPVPEWLERLVVPWEVRRAELASGESVVLTLRAKAGTVRVRLAATPAVRARCMPDLRVPEQVRTSLEAALIRTLDVDEVRRWLTELGEVQVDATPLLADWPRTVRNPRDATPPLPSDAPRRAEASAEAAALIHRALAHGDYGEAFARWSGLARERAEATEFVHAHLRAIMLAMTGDRGAARRSLTEAEALASSREEQLACAWARELLLDDEGRLRSLEALVAMRCEPADLARLAAAQHAAGRVEERDASLRRLLAVERPDLERALEIAELLEACGRYDEALALLRSRLEANAPGEAEQRVLARLAVARLHVWRRELPEAEAELGRVGDERPEVRLRRAAIEVLRRRPIEATGHAAAAVAGGEREGRLWLVEAHLQRGQVLRAAEEVERFLGEGNTLAGYLLSAYVHVRVSSAAEVRESVRTATFLDGLVMDVFPSLREPGEVEAALGDARRLGAMLRETLDRFGGNRSEHLTWCRGGPRLEGVRPRLSGRDAAVAQLLRIRREPGEEVLAGFDAVARAYPRAPHIETYRGELLLWLGRPREAIAAFDRAIARCPTRWAYVGRAAAHEQLGEPVRAQLWSRRGDEKFGALAAATTHVYRGERLRRLRMRKAARRELEIALEAKPRRIGARVNLALLAMAEGRDSEARAEVARLEREAPAYLWLAADRGDWRQRDPGPLLDRVLEIMGGNRSSFLHTRLDDRGDLRVVPWPDAWRDHARLTLGLARAPLERAAVARALVHLERRLRT